MTPATILIVATQLTIARRYSYTAQHLRLLSSLRRRATLVATVLDTITWLTDDGVALFDRAIGRMFRRAEAREETVVLRDARAVNHKVRLLTKLGTEDATAFARKPRPS